MVIVTQFVWTFGTAVIASFGAALGRRNGCVQAFSLARNHERQFHQIQAIARFLVLPPANEPVHGSAGPLHAIGSAVWPRIPWWYGRIAAGVRCRGRRDRATPVI